DDWSGRAPRQKGGQTVPGAHAGVHGMVEETRREAPMNSEVSSPVIVGSPTLIRPDELAFTVVSADDGRPLAKRFWLDASGNLETDTAATLVRGAVEIEYVPSLTAFAKRLERMETHQAVLY